MDDDFENYINSHVLLHPTYVTSEEQVDLKVFAREPLFVTTKLDKMKIFNKTWEGSNLSKITKAIEKESKPQFKDGKYVRAPDQYNYPSHPCSFQILKEKVHELNNLAERRGTKNSIPKLIVKVDKIQNVDSDDMTCIIIPKQEVESIVLDSSSDEEELLSEILSKKIELLRSKFIPFNKIQRQKTTKRTDEKSEFKIKLVSSRTGETEVFYSDNNHRLLTHYRNIDSNTSEEHLPNTAVIPYCCYFVRKELTSALKIPEASFIKKSHQCTPNACNCCHKPKNTAPLEAIEPTVNIISSLRKDSWIGGLLNCNFRKFSNRRVKNAYTIPKSKLKVSDSIKPTLKNVTQKCVIEIKNQNVLKKQTNVCADLYYISENGYLFKHVQLRTDEDANMKENFHKITTAIVACCWFKRESNLKYLKPRFPWFNSGVWKFMKCTHKCIIHCECCCKPANAWSRLVVYSSGQKKAVPGQAESNFTESTSSSAIKQNTFSIATSVNKSQNTNLVAKGPLKEVNPLNPTSYQKYLNRSEDERILTFGKLDLSNQAGYKFKIERTLANSIATISHLHKINFVVNEGGKMLAVLKSPIDQFTQMEFKLVQNIVGCASNQATVLGISPFEYCAVINLRIHKSEAHSSYSALLAKKHTSFLKTFNSVFSKENAKVDRVENIKILNTFSLCEELGNLDEPGPSKVTDAAPTNLDASFPCPMLVDNNNMLNGYTKRKVVCSCRCTSDGTPENKRAKPNSPESYGGQPQDPLGEQPPVQLLQPPVQILQPQLQGQPLVPRLQPQLQPQGTTLGFPRVQSQDQPLLQTQSIFIQPANAEDMPILFGTLIPLAPAKPSTNANQNLTPNDTGNWNVPELPAYIIPKNSANMVPVMAEVPQNPLMPPLVPIAPKNSNNTPLCENTTQAETDTAEIEDCIDETEEDENEEEHEQEILDCIEIKEESDTILGL